MKWFVRGTQQNKGVNYPTRNTFVTAIVFDHPPKLQNTIIHTSNRYNSLSGTKYWGKCSVKGNYMKKNGVIFNTFTEPLSYFPIKSVFVERKYNMSLLVPCLQIFDPICRYHMILQFLIALVFSMQFFMYDCHCSSAFRII